MRPELLDIDAWLALEGDARRAILSGVVPDGWLVDDGADAEEDDGPDAQCVHEATGTRFYPIPGGRASIGLSDEERGALEALVATLGPEQAGVLGGLLDGDRLPAARVIELRPFLLAASVLEFPAIAPHLGMAPDARVAPDGLRLQEALVAVATFSEGLRLPTDHEWEHAYRAGATTPFPWGTQPPEDPAIPTNALGLSWMAEFYELCVDPTDPQRHFVRGGAAIFWPWHGAGEWTPFLAAHSAAPGPEHEEWLHLRLAASLDAPPPS